MPRVSEHAGKKLGGDMKRWGKGFTLIELLVVIAIIAILAAILFPVMAAAKARATCTKCLNNEKQLALAFRAYMDDHNGWMPKIKPWNGNANNRPPDSPPNWCASVYPPNAIPGRYPCVLQEGSLWPYTKNASFYLCEVDRGQPTPYVQDPVTGLPRRDFPLSYSVNRYLVGNLDSARNRRQSRILLLLHESRKTMNDGALFWAVGQTNDDIPSDVHYGGTNACFVDGHAVYLSYSELIKRQDSNEWDPNSSH